MFYCIHTSIKLLTRLAAYVVGVYPKWTLRRGKTTVFTRSQIRESRFGNALLKSESYWPRYTPFHITRLPECLIKRLHIFPMKDYNAYIIFEYITKTLVPGLWFSSFLTIYIPELWQ